MIVTIDGPAGSGKTTVAHRVAEREGFAFLDTGAMYRTITLACLREGVDIASGQAVARVLSEHTVGFAPSASDPKALHATLDGEDVAQDIRTSEVDAAVSQVSALPAVREAMTEAQRAFAERRDVVAEGRDLGTVVFPRAEVKVYLDASPEERARRRAVQAAGGNTATGDLVAVDAATEAAVRASLVERDEKDSSRSLAPLAQAPDAVPVDTTNLSMDEVVEAVCTLIALKRDVNSARTKAKEAQAKEASKTAPKARFSKKPKGESTAKDAIGRTPYDATLKPMRVFRNSYDDYYDHAMASYPWPTRALYDLIGWGVFFVTKTLWPWQFEGEDEFFAWLEAQDRGTVVVMNHVSMIEPVVTVTLFWRHGLRLRAIYKAEFNKLPMMEWIFTRIGCIPVDRGTSDLKALRRAQHALERGESILIFPEGTRIKDDDQPVENHGGFALIARMAKSTVTPMAVVGARKKGNEGAGGPFKRRHVFIGIGKALTFGMLGVKGRRAQLEAMETKAMERVYELRDELRKEHPGEV